MYARPVLIVEDDEALRRMLAGHIASNGAFRTTEAATLNEAAQHLGAINARFDSVILHLTLPDGDSRDFCARLRQQGHGMPIIMLSDTNEEADIVSGLDAGANDYIAKPYRAKELIARLHAQLRLFDNTEAAVFTIHQYTFRPAAKILHTDKKRIRLTSKEVEILKFLYRRANQTVARNTLLEGVWGYNPHITTHTLETHIYRLRQKIESDPTECRILKTATGGYLLDLDAP